MNVITDQYIKDISFVRSQTDFSGRPNPQPKGRITVSRVHFFLTAAISTLQSFDTEQRRLAWWLNTGGRWILWKDVPAFHIRIIFTPKPFNLDIGGPLEQSRIITLCDKS